MALLKLFRRQRRTATSAKTHPAPPSNVLIFARGLQADCVKFVFAQLNSLLCTAPLTSRRGASMAALVQLEWTIRIGDLQEHLAQPVLARLCQLKRFFLPQLEITLNLLGGSADDDEVGPFWQSALTMCDEFSIPTVLPSSFTTDTDQQQPQQASVTLLPAFTIRLGRFLPYTEILYTAASYAAGTSTTSTNVSGKGFNKYEVPTKVMASSPMARKAARAAATAAHELRGKFSF